MRQIKPQMNVSLTLTTHPDGAEEIPMELLHATLCIPHAMRVEELKDAATAVASHIIALRTDASEGHWYNWEWTPADKEDVFSECMLRRLCSYALTRTYFTITLTGGINLHRKVEAEARQPLDWQDVEDELSAMQKIIREGTGNIKEQMGTQLEYLLGVFKDAT